MKNSKTKIFSFVCVLLIMAAKAQVVPNTDWIKYYSQISIRGSISNAIDGNNNAYVTGYVDNGSNKDLIVVKYDSLGTLLWSNNYDNGGDDIGNCIRVDPSGNVFVVGG
ncbi:MAG: fibronectin type repeat, repeat and LamG-like domain protein, partial [Bacteroidetes bacterium]|nr:fibronectin type repeat, repeat and LamG-like domain protein [Bacteroidota bacterium]